MNKHMAGCNSKSKYGAPAGAKPGLHTPSARPRPVCTHARAFTLSELIVVIAIAAVLLGLSIGGYMGMNKTLSFRAAAQLIQGKLIFARNTAIQTRAKSYVAIDCKESFVWTYGLGSASGRTKSGQWHFEDGEVGNSVTKTSGAFLQEGFVKDGAGADATIKIVEGKYGAAFYYPGPGVNDAEKRYVECGKSSTNYIVDYNNARQGIALEAWVRPESQSGEAPLANAALLPVVARCGSDQDQRSPFALCLEFDSATGNFFARALTTVLDSNGSPIIRELVTSTPLVRANTWSHVSMSYTEGDGGLRLFVNGILRAETNVGGNYMLWRDASPQPVHIGHVTNMSRAGAGQTTGYFCGRVDEVSIGIYTRSDPDQIPPKAVVTVINPATPETQQNLGRYTIYFDSRGYLDRDYHSTLPEIIIISTAVKWDPHPFEIYKSLDDLTTFRDRYLRTDWDRKALDDKGCIVRLKLTWAGTVE